MPQGFGLIQCSPESQRPLFTFIETEAQASLNPQQVQGLLTASFLLLLSSMLDDFSHELESTQSRLDNVMKKLAKVSHMTSGMYV